MCYDLGKSYSKYESHPWKFATARPKFGPAEEKKEKKIRKKNSDENIKHHVLQTACLIKI